MHRVEHRADLSMERINYPLTTQINKAVIQPRNLKTASTKVVELTKLTTDDVVCWFNRGPSFADSHCRFIRHEINEEFSSTSPLGYQWTRVEVTEEGEVIELSREALCLFCQRPVFFRLAGTNSLLRHFELMHPHEVPEFVVRLSLELHLRPELEPRIPAAFFVSSPSASHKFRDLLEYRLDGFSNQLKFAPRAETTQRYMLLSEVSEKNVMYWYQRDIEDFRKYLHQNARYDEITTFDPVHPRASQISRVLLDSAGNELRHLKQFLCMYCQKPTFVSFGGCSNLVGHVAWKHWGADSVSRQMLVKLFCDTPARESEVEHEKVSKVEHDETHSILHGRLKRAIDSLVKEFDSINNNGSSLTLTQ